MSNVKKNSLEKISDALGTSFESQDMFPVPAPVEPLPRAVAVISEVEEIFADQEYLRQDLKQLIENSKGVLATLGNDIMMGSSPRMHEVYATLMKSTIDAYNTIGELNKNMVEVQLKKQKLNGGGKAPSGSSDRVSLTANQLSDLIDNARKNSSMNDIKVDFKVTEENKPGDN